VNGGINVYNYAGTSYSRSLLANVAGYTSAGNKNVRIVNGWWTNTTNAITSITITLSTGNFSGGRFVLYGVS